MKKFMIFAAAALFISACAVKQEPIQTTSAVRLIIKAPTVKLSGLGFYKKGGNYVNVQIFSGGAASLNYESSTANVCINSRCVTRDILNQQLFLHSHYPRLLDNILASEPIYEGKNLVKNADGFTQHIKKTEEYDITYSVTGKNVEFEDKLNKIYIRLSPIEKQI